MSRLFFRESGINKSHQISNTNAVPINECIISSHYHALGSNLARSGYHHNVVHVTLYRDTVNVLR